jgi:thiol-disulfide isomerase/thioredoxin
MMIRPKLQLSLIYLLAASLGLAAAATAQVKAGASAADLLKSIGIVKPAMTKAPDFTLRDIGGGMVSLASYRGGYVLLNFWATWCGPCRDEMPSMETLSRNFGGQGLSLVAINQKESAAQVASFMKSNGLNFPTPLDSDGKVSAAYRVFGIPVTYVIDGAGNAIGMASGARDWASRDVVEVFRKLVGDSGGAMAGGSMDLEPTTPLPSGLRARGAGMILRGQQDTFSEIIAKLPASEEVTPLGKVFSAGEHWYMVRAKSGTIGWVRGAEVEELRRAK